MRRRFELGLVLATVAHLAIVGWMRTTTRAPGRAPSASDLPFDVVLDETPPPPPPTLPSPPAADALAHATVPGASRARSTPGPAEPSNGAPSEGPSTEVPEPSEPVVTAAVGSAPSTWSYVFKNGAPPPSVVGTSSLYAIAPPKEDDGTAAGQAEAGERMRAMMHGRDVELGLSTGGPMVGPAEQSTRLSRAPVNGFSVVVATFGPDGVVMDVHVVDDNGDREAWDEVAKDIAEAMRSKHVRIPRGAHGVEVTMRIDSRWQLPDGSDPDPYKVCVVGLPCKTTEHQRVVSVGPNMISAPIPTNGGGPLRVVHARVVDEHLM